MAKYLVPFGLTGETMKRFVAKPSDRAAVVRQLADPAGGSIESHYWMFGQYDGVHPYRLGVIGQERRWGACGLAQNVGAGGQTVTTTRARR